MTIELVLLMGVIVFAAAVVQGTTGIGFALVSVTLFALLVGPKLAVILLAVSGLMLAVQQAVHFRAQRAVFRRLVPLSIAAGFGSVVGAQLLVILAAPVLSLGLAAMTLWYVVRTWRGTPQPMSVSRQAKAGPLVGLAAGLTNSSIGASSPILAGYFGIIGLRASEFMFGIAGVFFVLAVTRLAALAALEQYTPVLALVSVALCLPAVAGQRIGHVLHGRLSEEGFRRAILVVLSVAAVALVWRALPGLLG